MIYSEGICLTNTLHHITTLLCALIMHFARVAQSRNRPMKTFAHIPRERLCLSYRTHSISAYGENYARIFACVSATCELITAPRRERQHTMP